MSSHPEELQGRILVENITPSPPLPLRGDHPKTMKAVDKLLGGFGAVVVISIVGFSLYLVVRYLL